MITRYAHFIGQVAEGRWDEFKTAVQEKLVPTWVVFPGASAVRVCFATERDDGAPDCPLVLAVDYASRADLERALASQERIDSRAATQRTLAGLFDGKIYHYVTDAHRYPTVEGGSSTS